MGIVNDISYKHAKSQYKILCIVVYTKVTKSDEFADFKIYILGSTCLCHFLCSSKYGVFEIYILHILR
jgi:hypothetical protein